MLDGADNICLTAYAHIWTFRSRLLPKPELIRFEES
jgi:hypothetical protein